MLHRTDRTYFIRFSLSLSSLPLTALFYSINLLLLLSPFLLSSILSVQLETTCELREEDYEAAIENRENLFSNHRRNIILIIIIVITLNFEKGKKGDPVSIDFSSFAIHKFVNEREYFEESFRRECNMHTRVHADKTLEIFRPDQAQSRKRVQLKQRARLTGIVCTSRGCNPIVQRI